MLAYLFSRYPVVSQTFCDSEMLALESHGVRLAVASLNPPPDSFRHERLDDLQAEILYPPPAPVLRSIDRLDPDGWKALEPLIADHLERYGAAFKPETRARNALYFAHRFRERGVRHIHVHFANRATHTALFLRRLGFPFSFTAHARDFMVDLGSDELLREMAGAAEFVVAVSDFSAGLLRDACPGAAGRIVRIYNGIRPDDFPPASPGTRRPDDPLRIVSVGRLVDFKGFPDLIEACRRLAEQDVPFELDIVGDGPLRSALAGQILDGGLGERVRLLGSRSQEEIKALLARSDVFALACTTDSEGGTDILPTVIMEAMAARLPVISTTIAGVPEMVAHEVSGLLSRPGDPAALAGHLARCAGNPTWAASLGEAGARLCRERFALEVTATALERHLAQAGAIASKQDESTSRTSAPPVLEPRVAILLESWPPSDPLLAAELEAAAAVDGVIMCPARLADDPSSPDPLPRASLDMAFLPDGIVLESVWRRATPEIVAAIDRLRSDLGGGVDGETFYRDARRAVWLARVLRRRGIRIVHAARSDAFLTALVLERIWGFGATFTVERRPILPRSTIASFAGEFAAASVADARLAEMLGAPHAEDALLLEPPAASGEVRLGPLALKLPRNQAGLEARRTDAANAWYHGLTRLADGRPLSS